MRECRQKSEYYERQRKYRQRPGVKNYLREYRLKRKYGIGIDDKRTIYDQQLGICAGCGFPLDFDKAHIDHCHDTGQIRGLLHEGCNRALGIMKEDPSLLRNLANYAENVCAPLKAKGT
jgi:Recombination endonuclease VII